MSETAEQPFAKVSALLAEPPLPILLSDPMFPSTRAIRIENHKGQLGWLGHPDFWREVARKMADGRAPLFFAPGIEVVELRSASGQKLMAELACDLIEQADKLALPGD